MARSATAAILVLAAVALGGALLTPVTLVQLRVEGGPTLVCRRVSPDATIALTFTHSMYGGDVTETYAPGAGDTLRRTAIVTDNAAAAEYYAWDGAVRTTDSGFEVMAPDLVVDALPVRVDQIGQHRLTVDGTTWNLAAMVDVSERVWLTIAGRPLIAQVFGMGC